MLRARLREDDVAAHLDVDPKTVRRWLSGRVPYPSSRAALADLVGVDEAELWPEAVGPLSARSRPDELAAVYPHRWAIPRDVWTRFFQSAEHEIGVLAYSALFLAEDAGLLDVIKDKALTAYRYGSRSATLIALAWRYAAAKRASATRWLQRCATRSRISGRLLKSDNVEIRLHNTVLYNSIYRADDQLFVNQHAYGLPASHSPVFCFRASNNGDMPTAYLSSFERVWDASDKQIMLY